MNDAAVAIGTNAHVPSGTMTGERRPRIPADLATIVDERRGGVPFERFIREAIEKSVGIGEKREFAEIDEGVAEAIEMMRFWAYTEGYTAGYRRALVEPAEERPDSGLAYRMDAAEAYNREYGTDHMGDMLRRHPAKPTLEEAEAGAAR